METSTTGAEPSPKTSAVTYAACPSCYKVNKISLAKAASAKPACGACKAEIDVHGAIVNMTTQQLQAMIKSSPVPVVVDFWAPWCGPCRSFAPTFERVASELTGRAAFVKLNTEEHMFASQAFGIRGIPALLVFKGGLESARQAGALPYEHFKPWVSQALAGR